MRESEKAEAYTAAINLLVDQAVTTANPNSPGAYAATVRADLSARHRDAARDAFRKHGDLTAEHLAILLTAADSSRGGADSREASGTGAFTSRCGTTPANPPPLEPWTPPEPEPSAGPVLTRTAAAAKVAAIKAHLRTVTKPPITTTKESR